MLQILTSSNIITPSNTINRNCRKMLDSRPKLKDEIITQTSFLDGHTDILVRIHCIQHNITSKPTCNCGNQLIIQHLRNQPKTFSTFCSVACANNDTTLNKDRIRTKRILYGDKLELIVAKTQNTNIEKLGVKSNLLTDDHIKHTKRCNELNKEQIIATRKQTSLERYGIDHPCKTDDIKEKIRNTTKSKYNVPYYNQHHIEPEHLTLLNDPIWLTLQHHELEQPLYKIAELLEVDNTTVSNYFLKHNIQVKHRQTSFGERELSQCLTDLGISHISNDRSIISPKELDIYIPHHNLAIEYCGLYWHSEQRGKDKWYHHTKYMLCKEHGIQLITLFEDEWMHRREQVLNKIKYLCNCYKSPPVYARKTTQVVMDSASKNQFMDINHLQGRGPGSVNLALQHQNNIVAVMSFIKREHGMFILNRYATSTNVPGGFSKLLNFFKHKYDWTKIETFADLRWSMGNLYEQANFIKEYTILPDYSYSVDCMTRYHKSKFRRKNLDRLLPDYNPNLSERINCDNNNIKRIWDCGKIKYVQYNT